MDFKIGDGIWALAGAIIWEISKQLFGSVLKRKEDSKSAKIQLLKLDLERVIELTLSIHENVLKYYSMKYDTDEAKEVSRHIKVKMKETGMMLNTLNYQFEKNNQHLIKIDSWTKFKQAATDNLDVKREDIWSENDVRIANIYKYTNRLQFVLNRARYKIH